MPTKTKQVKVCQLRLIRNKGKQLLHLKTTKKLEDFFKTTDIKTSDNYLAGNGSKLKFYGANEAEVIKLKEIVSKFISSTGYRQPVLDRYGVSLKIDGYTNLSLLRTVDAAKGVDIQLSDLCIDVDINEYARYLGEFIKFLYRNYIAKLDVRAEITIEM